MRFKVEDSELLAELLREVIEQQFDGNVARAARYASLVPSHLVKMLSRRSSWINGSTRRRIERLVPSDMSDRLDDAVSTQAIPGPPWDASPAFDDAHHDTVLGILRIAFPDDFAAFDEWLLEQRIAEDQARAAYLRIVEPLFGAPAGYGTRMNWNELDGDRLRRFLVAGMEREQVVLSGNTGHTTAGSR